MNILVFIPARGGSKGIRNKNLIKIGDKKLIDFTIDTAKKLGKDTFYFVSTDSETIQKHCNNIGHHNSYIRPSYLARDTSNVVDAVFHDVKWLEKKNIYKPEAILLLQPTSPFRNNQEIKKAIKEFKRKKIQSLVGAVKMSQHPNECLILKGKKWKFLNKNKRELYRRQQYQNNFYFIDGSFYLCKLSFLLKYKKFIKENITEVKIFNNSLSLDIDDLIDLRIAKAFSEYYV